ncbi:MAG: hypothetical protein C4520_03225 [Candidatus Abyssobacteria bacterium SURF_5]|uniref:Uncharacterized protein n=1 Tax=Abyssobacteria bacterium (strain SURF_5) TaxID=2093360 RepID=A0A3A4NWN2_ABYX5|nr:MAG: hypothetical protein C4520_03225 [Candidatus Abyssubacteria bacterium SURF_5]
MSSLIILAIIILAAFVFLAYLFRESKIELDSLTIAAVEAKREPAGPRVLKRVQAPKLQEANAAPAPPESRIPESSGPAPAAPPAPGYEYRELLEAGGDNFVIPQWMVNYFSSSEICHTLDQVDRVVLIVKLNDPRNANESSIDLSAECDMNTQTASLKLSFGEGAAAEQVRTKFYLFERGDLFELNRLVRQQDVRIDVLTRAADYSLEYAKTTRIRLPQDILAQLKNVLSKIPS